MFADLNYFSFLFFDLSLSNDDELEDGIKRYFFGYYIGNRLLKNNRDPPKIEHKKYADGDEACDFDN